MSGDNNDESIIDLFDSLCVSYGDSDAIVRCSDATTTQDSPCCSRISFLELQEASLALAHQLKYRYRPDYVMVDCFGHAAAEATTMLACMRLSSTPFCPVSVENLHAGGRLDSVVQSLVRSKQGGAAVVAVCCAANDQDPRLGIFYQANVHCILFVDPTGNLQEQIPVPQSLPRASEEQSSDSDCLYVMFTSGTSGANPKAVVGSQRSTARRLQWFRKRFSPSAFIARRTPLTFVDGVTEIFTSLLQAPDSVLVAMEDPTQLQAHGVACFWNTTTIRQELTDYDCRPTQITLLPSQLEQLLFIHSKPLRGLERVIVSGEPCSECLYRLFRKKWPKCQLINLYGQTESTGDVLCAELSAMEPNEAVVNGIVAVGEPILPSIVQCRLDPRSQVEAVGDNEGELIVSGNLSLGYLTNDCESRDFSPMAFFATKDAAFHCKNSKGTTIWYVRGRCDDIEKINGIWTSPSEIEAAFIKYHSLSSQVAATIVDGAPYIVVPDNAPLNNRKGMHEAGIQWNVIPLRVISHAIPLSEGTGKVARARLKALVVQLLQETAPLSNKDLCSDKDIAKLVANVLNLNGVDERISFANLGGDSASAVTLLYQLRLMQLDLPNDFSAVDILEAKSIAELKDILEGTIPRKKQKLNHSRNEDARFVPSGGDRATESHNEIQFLACVDASPVSHPSRKNFYAACQGGVVQSICSETGTVLSHRHFVGRRIQADCLVLDNAVIVCGYDKDEHGFIASIDTDLKEINWIHEKDVSIKTTPFILSGVIVVQVGSEVQFLDQNTGCEVRKGVGLPAAVTTKGVLMTDESIIFASCDYEYDACMVLETGAAAVKLDRNGGVGPVHKNPLTVDEVGVLVADSWGYLHLVNFPSSVRISCRVSNSALGSPVNLDTDTFIVGSYDGRVHCIRRKGAEMILQWELFVGATVYTKPLILQPSKSFLVCTTAGDVVKIQDGVISKRKRVAAEIWSDPLLLGPAGDGQWRVAFGARDSKVHVMII